MRRRAITRFGHDLTGLADQSSRRFEVIRGTREERQGAREATEREAKALHDFDRMAELAWAGVNGTGCRQDGRRHAGPSAHLDLKHTERNVGEIHCYSDAALKIFSDRGGGLD
jgi:hypothetical protein